MAIIMWFAEFLTIFAGFLTFLNENILILANEGKVLPYPDSNLFKLKSAHCIRISTKLKNWTNTIQ